MRQRRVLVVDDDPSQLRMYCRLLERSGHYGLAASSGAEALRQVKTLQPDVVLADINMPGMDGIKLFCAIRRRQETLPVILMTGMPVPDSMLEATAKGLGAGRIYVKGAFSDLLKRIDDLSQASKTAESEGHPRLVCRQDVSIDLIRREITVCGRRVPRLPSKRFDVLVALLRRQEPVSQEELLAEVWDWWHDPKTVQKTISRLREDLREFPILEIRTDACCYEVVIKPVS